MTPMNAPIDWLLEGDPYIVYRTRRDLLQQPEEHPQVQAARLAMLDSRAVKNLLADLSGWPGKVIASHKSASQPFHKLTFAADLGLKLDDPGMQGIIEKILAHQSPQGPFTLPQGDQQEGGAWALCDAPLILYALASFGCAQNEQVKTATQALLALVRQNGWPCAVSKELGNFRGPGRKDDPCPYATLAMLKAIAGIPGLGESQEANAGVEALLDMWKESTTRHPYMFFMGTDFRKLKVPFIWYDLVHVLEVLSHYSFALKDPRFLDMLGVLKKKANPQGQFMLESVWTAWKDWEFGQKSIPSRWLTLTAWRVIHRQESG